MDATAGADGKIGQDGAGRRGGAVRAERSSAKPDRPVLIFVFLLALVIPLNFFVGGLRLTPYRVLLLAMFIPLFVQWISGKMGRIILPDVLMAIYAVWIPLSLIANHGGAYIAFGGITAIESFGAYLLGRMLVRGREAFEYFVRCLLMVLLALLPLVALEALTGNRLIAKVVRGAGAHFGIAHQEMRWGMHRAQGPFEHPILLGVFASSGFALAWYVFGVRGGTKAAAIWTGVAGAVTFFSLSMGAFLSGMIQVGLMGYELVTRGWQSRWKMFLRAATFVYLFFYFFSHRGLIAIFIANFAFNQFAASVRLLTWRFGTDVVIANPLFGIGMRDDWPRPHWLTGSVDNFWLLNAMRYGLPAAVVLGAAVIVIVVRLGRTPISDPVTAAFRTGYILSLAGVCFALASVHAWNALYSYFFFLLGAGVWMIGEPEAPADRREVGATRRAASAAAPTPAGATSGRGARRPDARSSAISSRSASSPRANAARPSQPRRR